MNNRIATPENGSYGQIGGVEITETVISRLVQNAEDGYPGTKIRPTGRPARTDEPSRAVTVRLSESELAALMERAERENLGRSEAIRAALAAWTSPTA